MSLLDLHDDILFLIFSYLSGRNALHICLCAKRAYYIAIPQVYAYIRKFPYTIADFAQWRNALLSPEPISGKPRASFLHSVDFMNSVNRDDQPTVAAGLVQLFAQAKHMHSLCINSGSRQEQKLLTLPQLWETLGTLQSLRSLELSLVGPVTMEMLNSLPNASRIESLSLDQQFAVRSKSRSYPPLTDVLSRFSRLHSLKLGLKEDRIPLLDPSVTSTTVRDHLLPSLRNLVIVEPFSSAMIDLIPLCPKLSYVSYMSASSKERPYREIVAGLPWPPLRDFKSVMRSEYRQPPSLPPSLPGPIPRLIMDYPFSNVVPSEEEEEVSEFIRSIRPGAPKAFDFVRSVRPGALVLDVALSTHSDGTIRWADELRMDPPLRSLEMRFRAPGHHLTGLHAALRGLPLLFLGVHVVEEDQGRWAPEPPKGAVVTHLEVALALDPRDFFSALPTLRVLGIGDGILDPYDGGFGPPFAVVDPKDADDPRPRRTRWWWCTEGGREMSEIWREDAERARDIIERPGFDRERSLEVVETTDRNAKPGVGEKRTCS
ncbi:uncharacterized protein BXZ73DRAFT_76051 [Epithele typhae]|uniref:uncharacterized protein n=1 Tax=Epithele typhae TaxID=378194 RepID=UPI0020079916|nr:uncharacterized protein BXZ73DRAFT_76051 [Epithele typhae]KAH9939340.1 hypothetical protein BXZ73DRAFT_76051 [Epithele typhae]